MKELNFLKYNIQLYSRFEYDIDAAIKRVVRDFNSLCDEGVLPCDAIESVFKNEKGRIFNYNLYWLSLLSILLCGMVLMFFYQKTIRFDLWFFSVFSLWLLSLLHDVKAKKKFEIVCKYFSIKADVRDRNSIIRFLGTVDYKIARIGMLNCDKICSDMAISNLDDENLEDDIKVNLEWKKNKLKAEEMFQSIDVKKGSRSI